MKKTIVKKLSLISAIALTASAVSACGSGEGIVTETSATTTATMNEEQAVVVEQVDVEAETLENGTLKNSFRSGI